MIEVKGSYSLVVGLQGTNTSTIGGKMGH